MKASFERSIANAAERILFVPHSVNCFFRLRLAADVMLDPFHFGGGNSTYEALGLRVPIVTMAGAFMRGRVTYACNKSMGLADPIAGDAGSCAMLAVRVANDRDWRVSLSAKIPKHAEVLVEMSGAIKELRDFLVPARRDAPE